MILNKMDHVEMLGKKKVILSSSLTLWLLLYRPHYNVNMKAVQVGLSFLNISTDVFEAGDRQGTIIDSGTTLAYLPDVVYEPLVSKVCDVLNFFLLMVILKVSHYTIIFFWYFIEIVIIINRNVIMFIDLLSAA